MSNVLPFPGAKAATESIDTWLNAALLELADIMLVCDVLRQQVPKRIILDDAERIRQNIIKALAASAEYEQHRATMAAEVRQLKQGTK